MGLCQIFENNQTENKEAESKAMEDSVVIPEFKVHKNHPIDLALFS